MSVFISYRREDSQSAAGRLAQDLRRLGFSAFRDVDAIGPGAIFFDQVERAISDSDAVLVLIGKRWLERDANGVRRLDNPSDLLRWEVQQAISANKLIIPVLVYDATMPEAADLPDDLQGLTLRNAYELSDVRWDYDVAQLAKRLGVPHEMTDSQILSMTGVA